MRRGGRDTIAPIRRARGAAGGGRRVVGRGAAAVAIAAAVGSPIAMTEARAAISEPPATLEFGFLTGEWGIFADGDGFPGVPMQGIVGLFAPGTLTVDESVAEPGAAASVWMNAAATLRTDADSLQVAFSLSLTAEATVDADAPLPATAIATASFQRIDLHFLVLEPVELTIESLGDGGRWRVLQQRRVTPGFEGVFLTALPGLTLEAGPGEALLGGVDAGIRVTLIRVPGPPVAAIALAVAVWPARRRRASGHEAFRPSPLR